VSRCARRYLPLRQQGLQSGVCRVENVKTEARLEERAETRAARLDLGRRRIQPELMDSLGLGTGEHRKALRALARVNALSLGPRRFWEQIRGLASTAPHTPLRVLDVACGGGDVAITLARLARSTGLQLAVEGCDVNPVAVQHASASAEQSGCEVRFFQIDAIESTLPAGYDVVCSSLFLHHLSDEQTVDLLRKMSGSARRLVLIQDLVRSRVGYALAYFATRALTRSRIVHIDGPRSVEASFTLEEARAVAERAGLTGATLRRCWPERFSLVWSAP